MRSIQENTNWLRILMIFFGLFAMLSLLFYTRNLYKVVINENQDKVIEVVRRLEVELDSRLTALALLADDVEVKEFDLDTLGEEIKRPVQVLNVYNVGVYDLQGRLLTQVIENLPKQVPDHLQRTFQQALQGQRVISDKYQEKADSLGLVALMVPIYGMDSQIKGVLVGEVSLEILPEFIGYEWLGIGNYLCVLDSERNILYHSSLLPLGTDWGQGGKAYLEGNQDKIYSVMTMKRSPWTVILTADKERIHWMVLHKALPQIALAITIFICLGLLYKKWHQEKVFAENANRLRMERLMSVNQLAAGLAHEIRNPLTSIKGFIQLMEQRKEKAPNQEHLQIILNEIERIDKLVRGFQHLARPLENPKFVILDIDKVVEEVVTLMKSHCIEKNVHLSVGYDTEGVQVGRYRVWGDEDQLKQVLINIIKNGIDAVEKNGRVQVKLRRDDQQVIVEIEDNGKGMGEDVLQKMGTPFFTTKEEGNGLGLSVCFTIVESHNGTIRVDSEEGRGTVFSIVLPWVQ